jgi:hypothetical protein
VSIPTPQRSQIFIVERQPANLFIKLDRMLQVSFRILHAARNASIARKVGSAEITRSCHSRVLDAQEPKALRAALLRLRRSETLRAAEIIDNATHVSRQEAPPCDTVS